MTTTISDAPAPERSVPPAGGVTFPRVVNSEWIKFRTLRSSAWTLGVTVVLMVAVSFLAAWGTASMTEPGDQSAGSAAGLVTLGYFLAQLTVAVLGVLIITGEYSTGMIRSTFAAVPHRLAPLWAKALVLVVVVSVTSLLGVALAYLATLPFYAELGVSRDVTDAESLRILLGTPLYLSAVALLALGFGALLRHSAGALATVLGLMLVVETVFASIPLAFFENVSPFLPTNAGGRLLMEDRSVEMMGQVSDGLQLTPWQGFAVLVAWVVVVLGVAAVLLRRRDA